MDMVDDLNDDTTDDTIEVPIFLMGFTVEENYYDTNTTVEAYLSDTNGNIISQARLLNNSSISLEAAYNLENTYDLTLYETIRISADAVLRRIISYKNVRPETYILNRNRGEINNDRINLTISNIGGLPEIYASSGGGGGNGTSTNGGVQEFDGGLINSPGSYYFAIGNGIETNPRYFFRDVVTGDSSYPLDFQKMPITSLVQFNFPNSDNSYTLLGISRDPAIGIHFITNTNSTGQENYDLYLPDNAFNSYYLSYSVKENNMRYSANKILPMIDENVININRDFGFDISKNAIDDFSMTTFGNYDSYGVTYEWENQPLTRRITYTISGESAAIINFNAVNLFNQIFESDPEISVELFTDPPRIGVNRDNTISNYSATLSQSIKRIFTYDVGKITESISN